MFVERKEKGALSNDRDVLDTDHKIGQEKRTEQVLRISGSSSLFQVS